jgi:hypothetical protein
VPRDAEAERLDAELVGPVRLVGNPDVEDNEEIVGLLPACARREVGPFGRVT